MNADPLVAEQRPDHFAAELRVLASQVLKRGSRWRRLGLSVVDAEELLQNAFVRVLERREVIERGAVKGFFRRALQHEKLGHLRREHDRQEAAPTVEPHLRAEASQRRAVFPFRSPETERRLHEAYEAVTWLLEQVSPDRRRVAAECFGRILRDGELAGVDEIAEDLKLNRGTVGSQWARAKEDIRAAVDRERPKGDRSKIAALFALLAGFCAWLVGRGRRVLDPAGGGPSSPSAASGARRALRESFPTSAVGARTSHAGSRQFPGSALLTCALLPLAVLTHEATRPRPLVAATTTAVGGLIQGLGGLADWRQHASEPAKRMAADIPAEADTDRLPEPAVPLRALPAARPGARGAAPAATPSVAEPDGPRDLLRRATALLKRGRADLARIALRDYRRTYPEDPRPAEYSRLLAATGSLDGAHSGGIR